MRNEITKLQPYHSTLSSVEMVTQSLLKTHTFNKYGAFIHVDEAAALSLAEKADLLTGQGVSLGPLHGIPFAVKDNIHVKDMPNTAGTNSLREFVPTESNPTVQTLVDAGAIVIGKTNMHELAFGITSNNTAFGPVANAHDITLISGGSSGGSATSVALGIVPFSLGTDTGGSGRIPTALNGVVGFRPTLGRYNTAHVTPIAKSRDTISPIAQSVVGIATLDNILTNNTNVIAPCSLKGLRLGIPRKFFYENIAENVSIAIEETLTKLANAGAILINIDMVGVHETNQQIGFPIALYEVMKEFPEYLARYKTGVDLADLIANVASPDVSGVFDSQLGDAKITDEMYNAAIYKYRPILQEIYQKAFDDHNISAMLLPATPLSATPIKTSDETVNLNGKECPIFPTYVRNTDPSSNIGLPSLSIPIAASADLPVGMLIDGLKGTDRRLIAIGLAIEELLGNGG